VGPGGLEPPTSRLPKTVGKPATSQHPWNGKRATDDAWEN
jgi:hypothetical protein